MSIIIFSRPIHSGKTTELLQWCTLKKNIHGILMPDINGSRKALDLNSKDIFDIQCNDAGNTIEPLISVGRFHFYSNAFNRANLILLDALIQDPDWLIIDEAGKLELEKKGFYPALKKAAEMYNNNHNSGNLLITVRDSLCEEVIRFFNLKDCSIISSIMELDK